jgi:uncharacterized membrane protein YeaQ/YmgE (transglycosylase-associated protein family)
MLNLLWIIFIGLIAGAVAKFLMPGKDPGGILVTIVLGVAGALLSTLLGRLVGWYQPGDSAGFIGAVIGAVILLLLYRLLKRKKA